MQHLCQYICTFYVQKMSYYRAMSNIMHYISAYLENSVFLEYEIRNLRRNDFLQM